MEIFEFRVLSGWIDISLLCEIALINEKDEIDIINR